MKLGLYMRLAKTVGQESTCPRANTGAVIVLDDRVVSLGYNGAPRKIPHCKDEGCWLFVKGQRTHCFRAVHAELNALLSAAYHGARTKGALLFCTHSPCLECLKACINAGISQIMYKEAYDDSLTQDLYILCKDILITRYEEDANEAL